MPSIKKINTGYEHVFGFLSKTFMKGQPEYKDVKEVAYLFKRVVNHADVFDVNPEADVILCSDEWTKPNGVYKTLEDAQCHDDDTVFICNWKDDKGNVYYTCAYKDADSDSDDLQIVTRTSVFVNLGQVSSDVIDAKWHAVRLCFEDGDEFYVWESYPMDTFEFMDLYTSWVKRFGEWEHESSDDSDDSETDDSDSDDESESDAESQEDDKEDDEVKVNVKVTKRKGSKEVSSDSDEESAK